MAAKSVSPAAKNGILNIASAVLSAAGKSAAYMIGPAILNPTDFGIYAYLSWLASVASQIGSAGFVQSAQRFSCRFPASQKSFSRLLIRSGLLVTAALSLFLLLVPGSVAAPKVLAGATVLAAIGLSISAIQQGLLQARHNFARPLQAEATSQTGRICTLVVLKAASLITAGSLLCVDALVSLFKTLQLSTRTPAANPQESATQPQAVTPRDIFAYSASIILISIMDVLLWQRGEMFFLGRYSSLGASAQFAVAAQVSQLLILGPSAALASLLPRLSEKAYASSTELNHAASTLLTLAALFSVPLYAISILVAPLFLALWKPSYAAVGLILPQLMIGKTALLLSAPMSLSLYASGRQKSVLGVVLTSGAAALLTDYTLIRPFGLTGAAWACALNQTFTSIATYVVAKRSIRMKLYLSRSSQALIGSMLLLLMGAAFSPARVLGGVLCPLIVLAAIGRERSFVHNFLAALGWSRTWRLSRTNA